RAPLEEDVRAEPAEVLDAEREVELPVLLEPGDLLVAQDPVDELLRLVLGQNLELGRLELAVDTDPRGRPRGQVEVGTAALNQQLQELFQADHDGPPVVRVILPLPCAPRPAR